MGSLMFEVFIDIYQSLQRDIAGVIDANGLEDVRASYLGKSGRINKAVKNLSVEELKKVGSEIKDLKQMVEGLIDDTQKKLFTRNLSTDLTVPGEKIQVGSNHLLTQAIEEISEIFGRLGFVRRRYPEVDFDWYAAEGL